MLATLGTVVLPVALAELIEVLTGERSALLSVGLAIALSALIATAGSWVWQRRPGGRDILFGDLMLLGFVRRLRAERTLAETTRLLGVDPLSAEGVADRVQMLEQLARALDARDPFMVGHSLRVARNAEMVAARMGLPPEQVTKVRIAAAVHDAGKINTPTSILNKRERADRRGVRHREAAPRRWRADAALPGRPGDRGDGAPPSRAPRRERLSRPA